MNWLLCFCDEENTFWLTIHLIENILTRDFFKLDKQYNLQGLQFEKYIISHLLSKKRKDKKDYKGKKRLLDKEISSTLLDSIIMNLGTKIMNSSTLFIVWNDMFLKDSIIPLE